MHSPSYRQSSTSDRASSRRRAIAFLLALVVHVLIIVLLLRQAPYPSRPPETEHRLIAFQLPPEPQAAPTHSRAAVKARKASSAASPRSPAPPAPPKATAVTPPAAQIPFLKLSTEEFAAADIAKLPSHRDDQNPSGSGPDGAGAGAGTGKGSGSVYGPGEGPGGVQLYDADWYRRPTHAELATYVPSNAPPKGWGLVACKTIENYHVENCQAIGESPLGSGFARAVRLAAWQFLVMPPRIDGRPVVGAWVRIRIEYTQSAAQ